MPSRMYGKRLIQLKYVMLFPALLLGSSCAMIMPDRSAPKSANYTILPPKSPWVGVPVGADPDSVEALRADAAYENPNNGAIISVNSICRKYWDLSIDEMSKNLVLGIKNNEEISHKYLTIDGGEAKDVTHHGIVDGVDVKIRTIVVKKNSCTYDFIYVAKINEDGSSEETFNQFINSFKAE